MKKIFKIVIVFCFLLLTVTYVKAGFPSPQSQITRANPLLIQVVHENPDQVISVIIQKSAIGQNLEKWVEQQGGTITKDLHIIHAFSVNIKASKVLDLVRDNRVAWISLDAPIEQSAFTSLGSVDSSSLLSTFVQTIGADKLWKEAPSLQGTGITVAIVDSGINPHKDIKKRILTEVNFNSNTSSPTDWYGHGTHIAGTIGGNGFKSKGSYIGVAPNVNLINVKVSNDHGGCATSDVIAGLQWVFDNKSIFNIRIVNLSLNGTVLESYHTSPLDAALEILWFNGIVVIVSVGNTGTVGLYPPANDPFVITVGATDDQGTANPNDDLLASFSNYGTTIDGFVKPDIHAPGVNIISLLAANDTFLAMSYPDHIITTKNQDYYFKMSGTSMASAVAAGATALLLENEPYLNPDQVKYRLINTSHPLYDSQNSYIDIYAAVHEATYQTANTGLPASQLLWTGSDPVNWGSVNWGSVNWGSVNWGSVNWGSVNWGSVNWGSDYWNQ